MAAYSGELLMPAYWEYIRGSVRERRRGRGWEEGVEGNSVRDEGSPPTLRGDPEVSTGGFGIPQEAMGPWTDSTTGETD